MSTTLVNASTRPVELHLLAGVTVLGPAERLDCDDDEVAGGQIAALMRRGVLSALPQPPADQADDPDDAGPDDAGPGEADGTKSADDTKSKASSRPKARRTRRASDKPAESS